MEGIEFEVVETGSVAEASVRQIQEQYRQYFFVPFPQLERAIVDGNILAAIHEGKVVGYAWSILRNGIVKIRYLAVAKDQGRSGIGRAIVQELIRRNRNAYTIRLSCRTDYPGWKFWKKVGFTVLKDRPGRAKRGSTVTDFVYHPNQVSLFSDDESEALTLTAVDANIFFDITDEKRPHHQESGGLLADWLSAEIELCVTVAIKDDICRMSSSDGATQSLEGWRQIEAPPSAFACIEEQLFAVIGEGLTPQDKVDRAHLTHAIAENLSAFITRDEFLLSHADAIYHQFGISIKRPVDFIMEVDNVLNQDRYDRHDLLSVGVRNQRIRSADEIAMLDRFRRSNEKESVLRAQIRGWLANPATSEVWVLSSGDNVLTLCVLSRQGCKVDVPIFRCDRSISGQRRGRTVMQYLASRLHAHGRESSVLTVSDENAFSEHRASLSDAGFILIGSTFYKVALKGIWNPAEAAEEILRICATEQLPSELADWFREQFTGLDDAASYLNLERAISPGKLNSNGKVACLVIPIRPQWARALFDANLGQKEFWQQDADLLFNPTSAYYSSARISTQQGRVLWYVSESESFPGSKRIRACSQLTGRVIDKPLALYRRFRHFGIFGLADVEEKATTQRPDVMAMEFCRTELFSSPVKLSDVQNALGNTKQVFQWPTIISESNFFRLYELGVR